MSRALFILTAIMMTHSACTTTGTLSPVKPLKHAKSWSWTDNGMHLVYEVGTETQQVSLNHDPEATRITFWKMVLTIHVLAKTEVHGVYPRICSDLDDLERTLYTTKLVELHRDKITVDELRKTGMLVARSFEKEVINADDMLPLLRGFDIYVELMQGCTPRHQYQPDQRSEYATAVMGMLSRVRLYTANFNPLTVK